MKDIRNILLILACVVILSLYIYYQNKLLEFKQELTELLSDMQMKKEFYESNYKYNSKMDGLKAPDIICRSQNNEEKLLSLFVKDKPVLIFRQVDKICISCKSEDIKILFDFIKKNTTSAVILCASHQREDIDILIKQKMVEIPVYDISSNAFNWNLDDGYNPYYFVLHPDMKISNIYVPGKSFPEMNKAYLESVKRLLAD